VSERRRNTDVFRECYPSYRNRWKAKISEGVLEEAGNRSIDDLAEQRDKLLLGLLALRNAEK
jgi:hypothetical protein